jgi:NTP pyrophosphatase (non-canonical NTP hydrolase)
MAHEIPANAAFVLEHLISAAHTTAIEHGFYADHNDVMTALESGGADMRLLEAADRDFTLSQIAKIASECGEAVCAIQKGKQPEEVTEELADVVIRILDLCGHMDMPLGDILVRKMEYNKTRPYKHGKKC